MRSATTHVLIFLGGLVLFAFIGFVVEWVKQKKNRREQLFAALDLIFSFMGILGVILVYAWQGIKYSLPFILIVALVVFFLWRFI